MELIKQSLLLYINQILNDYAKTWGFNKNTCIFNYITALGGKATTEIFEVEK